MSIKCDKISIFLRYNFIKILKNAIKILDKLYKMRYNIYIKR